jgi:L-fucose isomerase
MRCEYVDMSELTRRIDREVFDSEEYARARKWVRTDCMEGKEYNPPEARKSTQEKEKVWDFVTKRRLSPAT